MLTRNGGCEQKKMAINTLHFFHLLPEILEITD